MITLNTSFSPWIQTWMYKLCQISLAFSAKVVPMVFEMNETILKGLHSECLYFTVFSTDRILVCQPAYNARFVLILYTNETCVYICIFDMFCTSCHTTVCF